MAAQTFVQPLYRVRTVLLQDGQGKAQVILPTDWMLDLKQLYEQSERKLLPLKPAELVNSSRALQQLDLAPGLFLLPTFIDESIAISAECQFEILDGDEKQLVTVSVAELKAAIQKQDYRVSTVRCAVPVETLPPLEMVSSNDKARVAESIQHLTALRIVKRLDETLEMPPLPVTAQRIIQLRSNPDSTVRELTDIVEDDASLAAQVVSWASSPYYAAPGRIRSVQDAIVRVLGFDLVSNLALGLVMGKTLSLPKDSVAGLTPYWLQSVYCSTAVEAIARQMPARHRPSHGLAYLAGLLHNFGYLVMAHTFPPHFSLICRYCEANPEISHMAIENLLIGITREQIGAQLMATWRMPAEVCVALRHQHNAGYQGEHSIYAHLIYMALRLLRQHGIGDAPLEPVPDELYGRYGLEPDHVMDAVQIVVESEEIRRIADNFPR
jgi:HD-like signal output (HDOD) protein